MYVSLSARGKVISISCCCNIIIWYRLNYLLLSTERGLHKETWNSGINLAKKLERPYARHRRTVWPIPSPTPRRCAKITCILSPARFLSLCFQLALLMAQWVISPQSFISIGGLVFSILISICTNKCVKYCYHVAYLP